MRTVRPVGHHGLLVECDDLQDVMTVHRALAADRPRGVVDLVPAARTVLLTFEASASAAELAAAVSAVSAVSAVPTVPAVPAVADTVNPSGADARPAVPPPPEREVVIPVTYDGADLADVAELTGIPAQEVVRRHQAATHRVAFTGFAPGFAYVVGDDAGLVVPRRTTPRTRVPSGSVALAAEFTGIYPREGPGGWQLIGRTDVTLWDVTQDPPALLTPGVRVRFTEASP